MSRAIRKPSLLILGLSDNRQPVTAAHCRTILIFPAMLAEKSLPSFSRIPRRPETNISRPITIITIHEFTPESSFFSSRNTNAPQMRNLSTNGSKMRPNTVTWPYLRAR